MLERIEAEQATEQLRLSEERYRNLVELAPDAIITVDLKGVITSCNSAAIALTGYPKEELIGRHFTKTGTILLEDIDKFSRRFGTLIRGNSIKPFELQFIRKDGTIRWGEARISLLKMGGKVVEVQTILRDITERKLAEEALKESEAMYSALVRHAKAGVLITQDQVVTFANSACAKLFGFTRDELIGMHIGELVPPEERGKIINLYDLRMAGEKVPAVLETKIQCKDNSIKDVEVAASMIQYKGQPAAMGILRNITPYKKAAKAIQESEKRYRTLFEKSPAAITLVDTSGVIIDCNKATEDLTGYSKEEIINAPFEHLMTLDPKDLPKLREYFMLLVDGQETEPYELEIIRKDGTKRWIIVINSIIKKDNEIIGFQIISNDITKQKQATAALRASEQKYKELADSLPQVVFQADPQGNLTFVNQNAFTMFGYTSQDFENGINALQTVIPEDRKRAQEIMRSLMAGKQIENREYTALRKDGTTFPVSITSAPIIHNNTPVGIRGIIIDISEQKRVEKALRVSEEKFRLISEQSLLGIVIVQGDLIKYANQAVADIIEYSIEEMQAWKPAEFAKVAHPEDRPFIIEQAWKKQRGDPDVTIHYSYRIITKTGNMKWIDQYSKTIEYEGGYADLVTIIDITEQKLAENALQESEELYRSFVQTFPGIAFQLDPNFTPIFVHGAVEQITGYSIDEFMTRKAIWGDIIYPEDRFRIDKQAEVVQHVPNTAVDLEYRILRKDGEIRWVQETLQSIGDESGMPHRIQGVLYDITERKKTEEALRESEAKYSTLVEYARDGVAIVQDDVLKFANRTIAEITGYTLEELIEKPFMDKISSESKELIAQRYQERLDGKSIPPIYEAKIKCKDGSLKDVEVAAGRIYYQGRPAIEALIRDITARKQEEEFRRDLEEKRLDFMEMTSHELRTPLTVIRGFSELLASRFEELDQENREKQFKILNRNVRRLERLVQSVSTLRQIDRGVFSLHTRKIDFEQFLDEVLEPYKALLGSDLCISPIFFHQQGQKSTYIEVDPDKINQALDNLLDNAIKQTTPPRQIWVTPEVLPDMIRISIRDNGAGIDSTHIDKIFEPFMSIPTSHATGGTGIGLYLAKKIMEAHGGDITVQSGGKGCGATFILNIPREDNERTF